MRPLAVRRPRHAYGTPASLPSVSVVIHCLKFSFYSLHDLIYVQTFMCAASAPLTWHRCLPRRAGGAGKALLTTLSAQLHCLNWQHALSGSAGQHPPHSAAALPRAAICVFSGHGAAREQEAKVSSQP